MLSHFLFSNLTFKGETFSIKYTKSDNHYMNSDHDQFTNQVAAPFLLEIIMVSMFLFVWHHEVCPLEELLILD